MSVRGSAWILAVAGLAGACSMILELSAVRLIAPWFGTSSAVWTHVIGVVLLALSTGYLLGARLSRGKLPMRSLGLCLLAAAAATGWVPAVTAPVASWFLGCIPPLVTEIVQRGEGCSAGDAGGRVLALSTAGSIVGTFATTYVALPALGLSRTFLVASILLALLGALVLGIGARSGARAEGIAALLAVAVLGALAVSRVRAPTASPGWRLVDSTESAYQSLRVVEGEDGGHPMRRLQVNEAFDSFQSVWQAAPGFLPEGYYYNLFALPPQWARRPGNSGDWRLSVLGLGAGTAWRVVAGELPAGMTLRASGAEIDPAVVELGVRWFDLPVGDPSRCVLGGVDARVALRHLEPDLDQIVLDAYANQMEIPAHLCTREFFGEVRSHLVPRGWSSRPWRRRLATRSAAACSRCASPFRGTACSSRAKTRILRPRMDRTGTRGRKRSIGGFRPCRSAEPGGGSSRVRLRS